MIRQTTQISKFCLIFFVVTALASVCARADSSNDLSSLNSSDFSSSSSNSDKVLNYDQQNAQDDSELDQELNQDSATENSAQSSTANSTASPSQGSTTGVTQNSAPSSASSSSEDSSASSSANSSPSNSLLDSFMNSTASSNSSSPAPSAEPAPSAAPSPSAEPPAPSQSPDTSNLEDQSQSDVEPDDSSQVESAPVSDEPNLNYEQHLHNIYERYYSQKMSNSQWQNIVQSKSVGSYKVQNGDNLWDISKTFFGDGFYWPKIWSLNGSITDPHLISPDDTIQFVMGDLSNPPSINVTSNSQSAGSQNESDANSGEPPIPPSTIISRPVVKHLPPSLPEWQNENLRGDFDSLGMEFVKRKIIQVKNQIPLTSYIAEAPPQPLGKVTEIEAGSQIASSYQYIYVRMAPGEGQVGDRLLAITNRGRLRSPSSSISGFLGYSIQVLGEVQLIEKVRSKDPQTGSMYRALVLGIVNPVSVGSVLIPGKIQKVKVTEHGPHSQVVAQIIGGAFFKQQLIYGTDSVAYINRGANDGLTVGQILPIRANLKVRDRHTKVLENVRPIGWLRVVKTTPHFATCIVVKAWSDVFSGDLTGSGSFNPNQNLEASSLGQETDSSGSASGQNSSQNQDNLKNELDFQ